MLPPFTAAGLLPAHPHGWPYSATMDEIRSELVVAPAGTEWREPLFAGWSSLVRTANLLVPGSRWWMWGELCTNHAVSRFGDRSTVNALLIVPEKAATWDAITDMCLILRHASESHRVDADFVVEFDGDKYVETMKALDMKWRPRAQRWVDGVDGVDVGFVEVAA